MKNLLTAIAKAKQEFKPIERSGYNPHFKSKYATLDRVLSAIDESLTKHDLILMQPTVVRDGQTIVKTTISKPKVAAVQKLPTEGERKAKAIFETMKAVGLKKDDVIQLAMEEYQTADIRSLDWTQIEQMQKRMAE